MAGLNKTTSKLVVKMLLNQVLVKTISIERLGQSKADVMKIEPQTRLKVLFKRNESLIKGFENFELIWLWCEGCGFQFAHIQIEVGQQWKGLALGDFHDVVNVRCSFLFATSFNSVKHKDQQMAKSRLT